jgi:hypothetical protein
MNGYINLIVFILTTILYFYSLKPVVTYETVEELPSQKGLAIYALIVILTQFGLNVSAIIEKCGGSASQNIGIAALFTFLPWTLLFGIVIAVLIMYPGFKSAFSDVVGYFYITGSAHILFSEMLAIKEDLNSKIEGEPDSVNKPALRSTAEALIKLCGNMGVLINQIVPDNFKDYWTLLAPLMKSEDELSNQPSYKNYLQADSEKKSELKGGQNKRMLKGGLNTKESAAAVAAAAAAVASSRTRPPSIPSSTNLPVANATETSQPETLSTATVVDAMGATAMDVRPEQNDGSNDGLQAESKSANIFYRDELLKLVVTRDNVGEAFWYFYTGILVISIIQYYILSRGCVSDAATMEKNYQKFLENEDAIQAQQEAGQNTTYTIG